MPSIDKIRLNNTDYNIGNNIEETLPVGTRVKFNGNAQDIPDGWEEVNDEYGIVDSGNNENGYYIKFADGTLICRNNTAPTGSYSNTVYKATWTFPMAFIDTNYTITGNAGAGNAKAYTVTFSGEQKTSVDIYTKCLGINGTNETCDRSARCIAIGRWK